MNLRHCICFGLAAVMPLIGCASAPRSIKQKEIKLTVVMMETTDDAEMIEDLAFCWKPIPVEGPSECLLIPSVSVLRLDIEKNNRLDLAVSDEDDLVIMIQRFWGKAPDPDQLGEARVSCVTGSSEMREFLRRPGDRSPHPADLENLARKLEPGHAFLIGGNNLVIKSRLSEIENVEDLPEAISAQHEKGSAPDPDTHYLLVMGSASGDLIAEASEAPTRTEEKSTGSPNRTTMTPNDVENEDDVDDDGRSEDEDQHVPVSRQKEDGSKKRQEKEDREQDGENVADEENVDEPMEEVADLVVPAGETVQVVVQTELSTQGGKAGKHFFARVRQTVVVDGQPAIPAGSLLRGTVTSVRRAARIGGRARMRIEFDALRVKGSEPVRVNVEPIVLEGESTAENDIGKVVIGTIAGAATGDAIDGRKGAVKGAAAGAAAGAAVAFLTRGNDIVLPSGAVLEAVLSTDLQIATRLDSDDLP